MTKAELIDQIAEKLLVKKKDVTPIVEEVFASIDSIRLPQQTSL